jgi:hypothetical protein
VSSEDPRYFNLKFFAAPSGQETWVQARLAQVAAVEGRTAAMGMQLETMPYQGDSPFGGLTSCGQLNKQIDEVVTGACSLRQAFPLLIPPKPYCADNLPGFLQIRSREAALKRRHIQLNNYRVFAWMPFDIDKSDAYFAAVDGNLMRPNFIAINRENGHSLTAYLLKTPVQNFAGSRQSPLHYLAGVERGYRRRLGADPRYTGVLAKNPLHPCWRVEWQAPAPYDLSELASSLEPEDMRPEPRREGETGIGRNCNVFDDTRAWSYRNVLAFKRANGSLNAWVQRCVDIAGAHNAAFVLPLGHGEVRSIGKSIAKWTWAHFSDADFSQIQSARSQRRWAGHVADSTTMPWLAMGMSRATYYRRKSDTA